MEVVHFKKKNLDVPCQNYARHRHTGRLSSINLLLLYMYMHVISFVSYLVYWLVWGARWLSGRVSDSGARGPGFETYFRRVVSLSKTLYSPKVLVNYPGSDGSVPT